MENHPDDIYQETILNIIICRAKIEYCRPKQKIINSNLPLATNDLDILTEDLENQIAVDQLIKMSDIEDYFISSPFGLAPKLNGKWRQIYHQSYTCSCLINCYILKNGEHLNISYLMRPNKR